MRAYLVCILDSDNYREPTFLFFKNISDAHEHIKNLILSEMKNSKLWSTKTEINYVDNSDGSDDQILRIDYSFGDGVFYVHTVHEIEVEDQDYICVYHHAYNGVGFYIEKIGSLEECQQQMKTSAINSATDFGVDMKNDGFFEVNNRDSCVDVGEEWHMYLTFPFYEYILTYIFLLCNQKYKETLIFSILSTTWLLIAY